MGTSVISTYYWFVCGLAKAKLKLRNDVEEVQFEVMVAKSLVLLCL